MKSLFSMCLPVLLAGAIAGSAVAQAEDSDFSGLVGKWVRTDASYTLEIASVAADGKAEVAYRNPGYIKIGEAKATMADGKTNLFVKLNDPTKGYPGSTYTLTLDAEARQLSGEYFQAVAKQTYDVVFEPVK